MYSGPYDVYLTSGCATPPDLDDLVEQIPELHTTSLQARLSSWRPGGFLGLDLAEHVAHGLLERLQRAHARGFVAPAAYRTPAVSREEAFPLGKQYIDRVIASRFPTVTFAPVAYLRESARWWTFFAGSPQLQSEGLIPGAVFASIDKLDGHVWTPEEMEHLFGSQ